MKQITPERKLELIQNMKDLCNVLVRRVVSFNHEGQGDHDAKKMRQDFTDVIRIIGEHSGLQRKLNRRWIPCSERMPENDVPVNIVWTNHKPESYYSHIKDKQFTATGVCHNGKWHWYSCVCVDYLQEYGKCEVDEVDEAIEILFWMPMPESPEV